MGYLVEVYDALVGEERRDVKKPIGLIKTKMDNCYARKNIYLSLLEVVDYLRSGGLVMVNIPQDYSWNHPAWDHPVGHLTLFCAPLGELESLA